MTNVWPVDLSRKCKIQGSYFSLSGCVEIVPLVQVLLYWSMVNHTDNILVQGGQLGPQHMVVNQCELEVWSK